MNNSQQPAFPQTPENVTTEFPIGGGLTKREYFAAMAMQGMIAAWPDRAGVVTQEGIASYAIGCADELLKQLES